MVVYGEMDGSPEDVVVKFREEDRGRLGEIEDGKQITPNIRRSERRNPSRAPFARGRLRKSGPKSPMMRMAEMRRSDLRGKDLRHSGMKGMEEMDLKSSKGKRGSSGRRLVLTTIREGSETDVGLVEGLEEEGDAGDGDHGGVVVALVKEVEIRSEEMGSLNAADKVFEDLTEMGSENEGMTLEL